MSVALTDTPGVSTRPSYFNPYDDNGGSALTIVGPSYALFAADTRLSRGYSILSRNVSKYVQLTPTCCVVTCGMRADAEAIQKALKADVIKYTFEHRKAPTLKALSQRLSSMLYMRRFFPYYTFNILVGLDEQGAGAAYSYDAIGSFNAVPYRAVGSAASMLMTILDTRLLTQNQKIKPDLLNLEEATQLAQDALTSATERDIMTGDFAEIVCIDASGIHMKKIPLKMD